MAQSLDPFEQASEAFSQGDYQQAAAIFSSLVETDSSAEVRYNLAICYFKLEQWGLAQQAFYELNQIDPEEDLVTYNLAITEKKLGNVDVARRHFQSLSVTARDSSIAQLASRQLLQLPKGSPGRRQSQSHWSAGVKTEAGSYDNLLSPSLEKNTGINDSLIESRAYFTWQSNQYTSDRWTLSGLLYKSQYNETKEYDADFVRLGLRKYTPWSKGYVYLGLDLDSSELDGEGYLQNTALEAGFIQRFGERNYWGAKFRHREVDSLSSEYEPFMGQNQILKINMRQRLSDALSLDVHYQYSQDNRDDSEGLRNFRSFSPVRHSVGSSLNYQLSEWRFGLNLEYRDSDYQQENRYTNREILRKDERLKTKMSVNWQLAQDWALSAEYHYMDNDSSIDTYNYHQQLLKLGVSWDM
jgi:tetratricopeptide (TPR) repeat protein